MAVGIPKYRQIVDQIVAEVRSGTYAVGDMLPTEHRLMAAYGVSRHTVRQATQALRQMGIIEARQGRGSIVVAKPGLSAFVERVASIEELVNNGAKLDRRLVGKTTVEADSELSQAFGCKPGREFVEMRFVRHIVSDRAIPTVALTVWIDPMFESISTTLESENGTTRDAIVEVMRRQFAFETASIRQNVSAFALDEASAEALGRPLGECALRIERRYYRDSSSTPHLRTVSICRHDLLSIDSYFQAN